MPASGLIDTKHRRRREGGATGQCRPGTGWEGPAPPARGIPTWLRVAAALLLCGLVFPLAQQVFFGKTDYVRHVQTTVALGAEVHRDRQASVSPTSFTSPA